MWKSLYDYARQLVTLKQQTEKNATDVQELQKEIKELASAFHALAFVVQRNQENEGHEREKLALRLENILLRSGRELPPGDPQEIFDADEFRRQIEALRQENEELRNCLNQRSN